VRGLTENAARRKRPAFEPPDRLMAAPAADSAAPRPAATTAGAVLVLLGAVADAVALTALGVSWPAVTTELLGSAAADADARRLAHAGLVVVLAVGAVTALVQVALAVLILRGSNWPRVVVMGIATLSIGATFVGWWLGGSEIRI
jgi:hypothetical protein